MVVNIYLLIFTGGRRASGTAARWFPVPFGKAWPPLGNRVETVWRREASAHTPFPFLFLVCLRASVFPAHTRDAAVLI